MTPAGLALLLGLMLAGCPARRGSSPPRADTRALAAETAWREGRLVGLEGLAEGCRRWGSVRDRCTQIALRAAHVQGHHARAVALHRALGAAAQARPENAEAAVWSLVHLERYREAAALAARLKLSAFRVAELEALARRPPTVRLDRVTLLPFTTGSQLDPFLPGVEAALEGQPLVIRLDTGGTWLIMGPEEARRRGIATRCGGEGLQSTNRTEACAGTASTLRLGDAVLSNVPVTTLGTLKPGLVIFGTNVLQRFLATVDYPGQRLILSRRGDTPQRRAHLARLGAPAISVPFYLWGDHYLLAHGRFGPHRDLLFFVDSGLVAVTPRDGALVQAGFTASLAALRRLGLPPKDERAPGFLDHPGVVGLGALEQQGLLVFYNPALREDRVFGGLRVDGLLSHAFLSRQAWTIDFDEQRFRFGPRRRVP